MDRNKNTIYTHKLKLPLLYHDPCKKNKKKTNKTKNNTYTIHISVWIRKKEKKKKTYKILKKILPWMELA